MFENASLKMPNSHLMRKVTCRDHYIPGAKIYKSNDTNSTWSTFEDFNDGHLWINRVFFDHQNLRNKPKDNSRCKPSRCDLRKIPRGGTKYGPGDPFESPSRGKNGIFNKSLYQ